MGTFLFGGRLSRIPYALIAVPVLVLQYVTPLIFNFAPVLFEQILHASLLDIGGYQIAMSVIVVLLPALILVIASIKRLRDIRLTTWLVLPLVLKLLMAPMSGFVSGVLIWLWQGAYAYSLLLVLALLVVPGRHPRPEERAPSAAF